MAVCMKYKHLGSIDFFSFMCLKETEKINRICLGIVEKGRQSPSACELADIFCFDKTTTMPFLLQTTLNH